jgi:hypothetical protein
MISPPDASDTGGVVVVVVGGAVVVVVGGAVVVVVDGLVVVVVGIVVVVVVVVGIVVVVVVVAGVVTGMVVVVVVGGVPLPPGGDDFAGLVVVVVGCVLIGDHRFTTPEYSRLLCSFATFINISVVSWVGLRPLVVEAEASMLTIAKSKLAAAANVKNLGTR